MHDLVCKKVSLFLRFYLTLSTLSFRKKRAKITILQAMNLLLRTLNYFSQYGKNRWVFGNWICAEVGVEWNL